MGESWRGFEKNGGESLNCFEQTANTYLGFEDTSSESSKGQGHTIRKLWGMGNPCYATTESLATLSPAVIWKVELVPNELCGLAQEISKQNVKHVSWFLLASYSKI